MADWNPALYLQFATERTRPAADLLARIPATEVRRVADLGCGPGNSTALLRQAWPQAEITGVDNSPAMLEQAAKALPTCHFVESEIQSFHPDEPLDVLYANASLQWVPGHETLFPHLISLLADDGILAVQMPNNWQEPSHRLMREVASEMGLSDKGRAALPGIQAYYDILTQAGCRADIWCTTYYHPMDSHQSIIDWLSSTGLRPYLQGLSQEDQQTFLTRYHQQLELHYPRQKNGQILLAFPRLFIVAIRQ